MDGWLTGHGNAKETIRYLLERLLSEGIVEGLLVPVQTPDGRNAVPTTGFAIWGDWRRLGE